MKKLNYLIIILMFMLLTGCKVQYDLEIDENFIFYEKLELSESYSKISMYNNNIEKAMDDILEYYTSDNINPKIEIDNEISFNKLKKDNDILFALERQYENFSSYNDGLFFKYYFKNSVITNENKIYTLFADGFNYDNINELTNNDRYNFDIENIILKIKIPFKVLDTNTNYIDEKTNTYYWDLSEENYVKLVFDASELVYIAEESKNINGFDKITSDIITNISGGKVNGDKIVENNRIAIYGLLIIIVLSLALLIVSKKLRKNNEI